MPSKKELIVRSERPAILHAEFEGIGLTYPDLGDAPEIWIDWERMKEGALFLELLINPDNPEVRGCTVLGDRPLPTEALLREYTYDLEAFYFNTNSLGEALCAAMQQVLHRLGSIRFTKDDDGRVAGTFEFQGYVVEFLCDKQASKELFYRL